MAGIDPYSHEIWLAAERPTLEAARGLIILGLQGWEQSVGIEAERVIEAVRKPEMFWEPGQVPPLQFLQ
jgi:hypothetical protein